MIIMHKHQQHSVWEVEVSVYGLGTLMNRYNNPAEDLMNER